MPIPKTAPPAPPKSSAPGKSVPKSEKNLDARDKDKPKTPETEEKKPGTSGTSEEEKEAEGDKKEGEEKDKDKKEGEEGEENEDEEEETEEEEEEESVEVTGGGLLNLLTIWGAIFGTLFILIDLTEIVLVCFAIDDFWILDIIGLMIYIVWQFIYKNFYGGSGQMNAALEAEGRIKAKAAKGLSKIFTGKWSKFLIPITTEAIPYLGGIVPTWTISFIFQIMDS